MDIRIEANEGCRRLMYASAAVLGVEQEIHAVMDEYSTASVPGFRKGKVPLAVLKKRFHKEITDTIGKRAASRLFREALRERKMERAGPARFTTIDFDHELGLTFTVEFDIMPAIDVPDFKSFAPSAEATDDNARKDELSAYLLGGQDFDLPISLVEQEVESAAARGQDTKDERLRTDAEQRVKLLLILQAIATEDGIEVDDRDVEDRIVQMAKASGSSRQALLTELQQKNGLERLKLFLLAEQTLDYILTLPPHPSHSGS
jgi:FKBP-type peptidyl-prolyl cis-trans isomerase (trigger factor)